MSDWLTVSYISAHRWIIRDLITLVLWEALIHSTIISGMMYSSNDKSTRYYSLSI